MPALAKNYMVICTRLRGFGDFSRPLTGYDGNTTAEDIYQLVSQLGFNNIYLVAHDVGAQQLIHMSSSSKQCKQIIMHGFPIPWFLPPEFGPNGPWWFWLLSNTRCTRVLIEGKEKEYLSWFIRGLEYNPLELQMQTKRICRPRQSSWRTKVAI